MCEHSVANLMTQQSESQDDMNRSTSDYGFWKMNPCNEKQRGIGGEKKNEEDAVNGQLFLMKYKALWLSMFFCMDWPWGKLAYSTQQQYITWDNFHYYFQLSDLSLIQLPRCYLTLPSEQIVFRELHIFCDASESIWVGSLSAGGNWQGSGTYLLHRGKISRGPKNGHFHPSTWTLRCFNRCTALQTLAKGTDYSLDKYCLMDWLNNCFVLAEFPLMP